METKKNKTPVILIIVDKKSTRQEVEPLEDLPLGYFNPRSLYPNPYVGWWGEHPWAQ